MSPEGVDVTQRDLDVVRWVGEMYTVDLDLFSRLYEHFGGRPLTEASRVTLGRVHAARLESLGFAVRRRLINRRWVFPTVRGFREAGLPFSYTYDPPLWKLDHLATVARLRLYLERQHPGATWEAERWIRRRYRAEHIRGRVPDGLLEFPDGRQVALEVELHRKTYKRYPELLEELENWDETWWYVRTEADAEWLRARMVDVVLPIKPVHRAIVLPPEVEP
jgi:hypothetical protein